MTLTRRNQDPSPGRYDRLLLTCGRLARDVCPVAFKSVRTFRNFWAYFRACARTGGSDQVLLETRSGLYIAIRNNDRDAMIVRDVFLDERYARSFALPESPAVVDIGARFGGFALYAAWYLGARVIAYEPDPRHFAILDRNIGINGLEGRIRAIERAVGPASTAAAHLGGGRPAARIPDPGEGETAGDWGGGGEPGHPAGVALADVLRRHRLHRVDLLRLDCGGAEYDILDHVPDVALLRVRNLVFEYHAIAGYERRLSRLVERLQGLGFAVRVDRRRVCARQEAVVPAEVPQLGVAGAM